MRENEEDTSLWMSEGGLDYSLEDDWAIEEQDSSDSSHWTISKLSFKSDASMVSTIGSGL